ncbi:hypothetical protein ACJ8CT_04745 [Klebsiella pneumoniae]
MNNLEAGQPACASSNDRNSCTGKIAADNKASGSGAFRQSNGASRPARHDKRTVDQTKSSPQR